MMTGASCARGDAQIKYFWSSMEGATVRIKFARKKENKRKRNDFGSTCRVHIFASLRLFFFFFFFFFVFFFAGNCIIGYLSCLGASNTCSFPIR